jgi:hypothetical protein
MWNRRVKKMSEYAYSFYQEGNYVDGFKSIAEAINAANADDPDATEVYVGKIERYYPHIDGDNIIERLQEGAIDDNEYADDWLDDVSGVEVNELEKKLNEVLQSWLKDHGHEPTFFSIVNEHKYHICGCCTQHL